MSIINFSAFRSRRAFTLVEVVVVITIISVLTAVVTLSTTQYDQRARDSERQSKANIIASALEKYYDDNFEYPGCPLITAAPGTVKSATLKSLTDVNVLKTPRAAAGVNSIVCASDVPASTAQDVFTYTCTSDTSCGKWELKYRKESDNAVVAIVSTHAGSAGANGAITTDGPTISLDVTLSGSNAVGTATATCASGTVEYQIQYYLNNGAYPAAWTNGATATTPVNEGESATFHAQARCVPASGTPSDYVRTASITKDRSVTAPSGLGTSVAVSGSTATGTVTGGSCAAGTVLKRQIRSMTESGPYRGAWTNYADIAGTSQAFTVSEGWRYYFQQQAMCQNTTTGVGSTWTVDNYAYGERPISAPPAPSETVSGSLSNIHWDWPNYASCPAETTPSYQWYRAGSWGATFGWWGTTDSFMDWPDNSQGYTFSNQVQQRCSSGYVTGAWSGSSGYVSYTRPVYAPGAPYSFSPDRQGYGGLAWNWTAPTCGQATQGQWRADFANQGGSGILWVNPPSGHGNYWWYGGNAYSISYANPGTALTTGWPSYGYVGDRNNQYAVVPPKMDLSAGVDGSFDRDNYLYIAVEYRCINPTSGAAGAFGPVAGYSYVFP